MSGYLTKGNRPLCCYSRIGSSLCCILVGWTKDRGSETMAGWAGSNQHNTTTQHKLGLCHQLTEVTNLGGCRENFSPSLWFFPLPAKHGSFITCASASDGKRTHLSCGISGGQLRHKTLHSTSVSLFPKHTALGDRISYLGLILFDKNITCWNRKVGVEYIIYISETSSSCQQ